eukprot:2088585-Lingulodinium_polyedra.AAC.1
MQELAGMQTRTLETNVNLLCCDCCMVDAGVLPCFGHRAVGSTALHQASAISYAATCFARAQF